MKMEAANQEDIVQRGISVSSLRKDNGCTADSDSHMASGTNYPSDPWLLP